MGALQERLPKAVHDRAQSKWNSHATITVIGLVLSLPFAISWTVTLVFGFISQYEVAVGLIGHEWESSRGAPAELFGIFAACFFFLAVPGAILAIVGFVRRKTPFAWITLAVIVAPWLLTAVYVAAALARLRLMR